MRIFALGRPALALVFGASAASAQTLRLTAPAAPFAAPVFAPLAAPAAFAPVLSLTPALALAPALAAPAQAAPLRALSGAPAPAPLGKDAEDFEAGHFSAMFDGTPLEGRDGERVGPRHAPAGEANLRLILQTAIVRGVVERALPALRESVALGSWNGPRTTLDESCCGDAAPKLAALLRARGVPARLIESEFHYFVILDLPEGQLIVDPTIRQFFGKKAAPRGVPMVFIGSLAELNALFRHHHGAKTTRYDVPRLYFSYAHTREEHLKRVEADLRAGGPQDLEPLRRHLGLPPLVL